MEKKIIKLGDVKIEKQNFTSIKNLFQKKKKKKKIDINGYKIDIDQNLIVNMFTMKNI